jgi:alpha-1,2-mannosyltransferase
LAYHLLLAVPYRERSLAFYAGNLTMLSLAFAAALRTMVRRPLGELMALSTVLLAPATVLVLSQAAFSGLWWGQDQMVMMSLIVIDLLLVPPRHRGWLVGLAAGFLLTPLAFALLLLRPSAMAVVRTVVAFLATALVAAAFNPRASMLYWFHLLPSGQVVTRVYVSTIARTGNSSLEAMFARQPFVYHVSHTTLWWIVGSLVALLGAFVAFRAQTVGLPVLAVTMLGMTTAVVSPVTWDHHWIWASLLPFVALECWRPAKAVAIAALVAIPLAYLRSVPLSHLITRNGAVGNLRWSSPSLVAIGVLLVAGVELGTAKLEGRRSQVAAGVLSANG